MADKSRAEVIAECTRLAFEDKMSFPETVEHLTAVGVERYHADLRMLRKTHYGATGEVVDDLLPMINPPAIAENFNELGIVDALRAIQAGKIAYGEFLRRIMSAGTASYDVFITGRKAIYTGRKGDFYIEHFPTAKTI